MLRQQFLYAVVCVTVLSGCATRSISDSGYVGDRYFHANQFYRGELTEFDVIGDIAADKLSESDIAAAFNAAKQPIKLAGGSELMVIQSGAITPDDQFLKEIGSHFSITPFSGVPPEKKEMMMRQLRMTAARGGIQTILCYWGVLETAKLDNAGKTLSWIPIAGQIVPDEKQQMRIRLKAVLLDVPSGQWTMLTPPAIEDSLLSAKVNRERADQQQVEALKAKGYRALVDLLIAKSS